MGAVTVMKPVNSTSVCPAITDRDKSLNVTVMQHLVEAGRQVGGPGVEQLEAGTGFKVSETKVEHSAVSAGSAVKYDLLGEIAEKTQLTRRTCAAISSQCLSEVVRPDLGPAVDPGVCFVVDVEQVPVEPVK